MHFRKWTSHDTVKTKAVHQQQHPPGNMVSGRVQEKPEDIGCILVIRLARKSKRDGEEIDQEKEIFGPNGQSVLA